MAWQDFPIRGFCPDLPVTTPGVITMATCSIATDRGIGHGARFGTPASSTNLNSASIGGALLSKTDGTQELIVGTATKLYGYDLSTTLTDRSAAAYSASTTNTWSVTNFGNIALAANLGDQLQQRTIGAAANFASVGAAPVPKASIVVTCGPVSAPFVMVFDYTDGVNTDRDGWKCSAVSDYTGWTSGTNSCATGRLLDNVPGPITAAIPYRDGVIAWKDTGMYFGEYTGPPNIWSWRRISNTVGCIGKNACCMADDKIYFASFDGLWVFDGSYPQRVPGYVQKFWAERNIADANSSAAKHYFRVHWDSKKHLIYFLPGAISNPHGMGLNYNTVSGIWMPTVQRQTPVAAAQDARAWSAFSTGNTSIYELIAPRYGVNGNFTVVSLDYTSSGSMGANYLYGWVITDRVNHPRLAGLRPHWADGPATGTASWVSGEYLSLPAERSLNPGVYYEIVTGAYSSLTFNGEGKLEGAYAAPVMTFRMTVTPTSGWELTGISIDADKAGRS